MGDHAGVVSDGDSGVKYLCTIFVSAHFVSSSVMVCE